MTICNRQPKNDTPCIMYRVTICCLYFMAFTPFMCWAITDAQREQIHQHFEAIGVECLGDVSVTPEDIENLKAKKMPTGENGPCFIACMFKKVSILDEQGMLAHDAVLDLAKKVFDDEEEIKAAREFLHSCASVNEAAVSDGNKGCERAVLAFKCMQDNASKFGFEI